MGSVATTGSSGQLAQNREAAIEVAEGLSIGSLSQRSGANIETNRYYEKIGVMPKPGRSTGATASMVRSM